MSSRRVIIDAHHRWLDDTLMGRLPFNPDLIQTTEPKPAARRSRGDQPLTVSQMAGVIKNALAAGVPAKVRVVGEVSNLSDRTHWFFSLKDEGASIRCVCFASAARRAPCRVEDGMQVVATGRIDFYDAQGSVQLYVDKIEPVGQGALELRLRQLMEELRGLGYFAPERKRPLPKYPCRVAVVTSRSAAALQDVVDTTRRRWGGCRLFLYDVRVQGAQAAPEVAAAIERLSDGRERLGIDAIIVTRGGGSIEDLWAFNDRAVADALFRCRLPVVAAIGHETDTTVAELVADLRCATPTQAAMTLVPDARELSHQLVQQSRRMMLLTRRHLDRETHRVAAAARHDLFRRPQRLVQEANARLDALEKRLHMALPRRLQPESRRLNEAQARLRTSLPRRIVPVSQQLANLAARLHTLMPRRMRLAGQRLESLERQLGAVNPHNVLQRGYSYTLTDDGRVLKKAADARAGATLTTVLADGRVRSTVEGQTAQRLPGAASPRRARRRKSSPDPDQMGLFRESR